MWIAVLSRPQQDNLLERLSGTILRTWRLQRRASDKDAAWLFVFGYRTLGLLGDKLLSGSTSGEVSGELLLDEIIPQLHQFELVIDIWSYCLERYNTGFSNRNCTPVNALNSFRLDIFVHSFRC